MYTQPPPLKKDEIEAFLAQPLVARLCSYNEDGTIHAAPVWFRYEDGEIVIGTPDASRKAKNVRRNKKVTVLVDAYDQQSRGVIIYGEAELDHEVDLPATMRLIEKYVPKDRLESYARGLLKLSKWVKIRVKPRRMASFDYGKDDVYRDAVKAK